MDFTIVVIILAIPSAAVATLDLVRTFSKVLKERQKKKASNREEGPKNRQ